jgi:hypothetical protein
LMGSVIHLFPGPNAFLYRVGDKNLYSKLNIRLKAGN